MKKYTFLTVFILFFGLPLSSLAQETQVKDKAKDAYEEMESGNLTLRFFNALSGREIAGASVTVEKVGTFTTDEEGRAVFPAPPEDGKYSVAFKAQGYVETDFSIEIMAGTIFFNRISISPVIDVRFLRVVVDWDKEPRDLDAHFIKKGEYHISYRSMHSLDDRTALLDIDARNGYGPETITVKEISTAAEYEYIVHDYSNGNNSQSSALSKSKATVKVYGNGRLVNIFQVPRDAKGTFWHVFTLEQGNIVEKNIISDR